MANLLRLAVLCLCVAITLAAATNDDPTPAPEPPPTQPPEPACTEGDRKADTTDCKKFTECKSGVWKDDKCFWLRKFDSVTKKCVWWGAECAKA